MRLKILKEKNKLNPLVIVLINAFIPLVNTFFPSVKMMIFTMIFALVLLLFFGSLKNFFKAVSFISVFGLLYYITLKYIGNNFLTMLFKMTILFVPSIILAYLLITQYNSSEVLSSLEKLHLPKIFVIALTVTLRYIPTFKKEFGIIRDAMYIRGVKFSIKYPLRTFEYLLVPQLFRCLSLSAELTAAGLTKGINSPNKRVSYFDKKFNLVDYGVILIMVLSYTLIIFEVV